MIWKLKKYSTKRYKFLKLKLPAGCKLPGKGLGGFAEVVGLFGNWIIGW